MLVLSPKLVVPEDWGDRGWSEREEKVTVIRPDGNELPATAQINVTHLNIKEADVSIRARWPITVWLTDRDEDEVPVGSKILVDPPVHAALLHEDASIKTWAEQVVADQRTARDESNSQ